MRLKINGETVEDVKATTVLELLRELGVQEGRVAVEVNLSVIRKPEFANFRLKDGDVVEIVNFVGGG